MAIQSGHLQATAPAIGRRCVLALAVVLTEVTAVLTCFRFDALAVFGSGDGLSCVSLGLTVPVCNALGGYVVPRPLLLPVIIVGVVMAFGLYDPRPLLSRLEQSRRSPWWLAANAAGALLVVSPYLLVAAGVPLSTASGLAPCLLTAGAVMTVSGLLLWLSDREQLGGTVKPYQVLAVFAMGLGFFGIRELQDLSWDVPALQAATFETVVFFLKLLGETATSEAGLQGIGVNDFRVIVAPSCSGIAGILMASAVMAGYILVFRRRLEIGRALLLIPLAVLLSWVLNAVRITALLMIGSYLSPDLAVGGFHAKAGWLSFCILSALMLVAAENISWFHRRRSLAEAPTMPLLNDPVVAQIAPFIVLLVSSLLAGAVFLQPESGYPLRAVLMAAAVFLLRKAYRAEIQAVDGVPLMAGALVAVVWLAVKAGGPALTAADILGPVSQGAVFLWVFFRIAGTVLLVPFIEEMFFRGYLLHRLKFRGLGGKGDGARGILCAIRGAPCEHLASIG